MWHSIPDIFADYCIPKICPANTCLHSPIVAAYIAQSLLIATSKKLADFSADSTPSSVALSGGTATLLPQRTACLLERVQEVALCRFPFG